MAQFAVTDADIVDGNWLDEGGSAVNLFDGVTPDTPGSIGTGDDTDWAASEQNPSASACAFGLTTIEDPVSSSGHFMRWRRSKDVAGGGTINLIVQIRQAYISEASQGTLIKSVTDSDLSEVIATTFNTLSSGEADAITNYSDLQCRFVASQI